MKRTLSLLLTMLLIVSLFSSTAFATENSASLSQPINQVLETIIDTPSKGVLTSPDGTTKEITGKLVKANILSNNLVECTYAYDFIIPRGSGSITEDDTDSSASVRAYNTVYLSTTSHNGALYVLLTKVSGRWTILDSQVSVSKCSIQYRCDGVSIDGPGTIQTGSRASVSNNYSVSTGFSDYVGAGMLGCFVGNQMTLTLKRGSSNTWTFTLGNIPYQY